MAYIGLLIFLLYCAWDLSEYCIYMPVQQYLCLLKVFPRSDVFGELDELEHIYIFIDSIFKKNVIYI